MRCVCERQRKIDLSKRILRPFSSEKQTQRQIFCVDRMDFHKHKGTNPHTHTNTIDQNLASDFFYLFSMRSCDFYYNNSSSWKQKRYFRQKMDIKKSPDNKQEKKGIK